MIDNASVSRPQSGLGNANIVYEVLAEGGITRFLAIFAPRIPIKLDLFVVPDLILLLKLWSTMPFMYMPGKAQMLLFYKRRENR